MANEVNNNVFGYRRNPKPRGVFSTEESKLTFGSVKDPIGFLVQNWNVTYQQQVQELFEIGSNALYWSKGRPVGNGTLGRIIGDRDPTPEPGTGGFFPDAAYDICEGGATMELTAAGGACATLGSNVDELLNKELHITMSGVVVTQIGFSMQVGDVRLMENFAWRFAYLKMGNGSVT